MSTWIIFILGWPIAIVGFLYGFIRHSFLFGWAAYEAFRELSE